MLYRNTIFTKGTQLYLSETDHCCISSIEDDFTKQESKGLQALVVDPGRRVHLLLTLRQRPYGESGLGPKMDSLSLGCELEGGICTLCNDRTMGFTRIIILGTSGKAIRQYVRLRLKDV